MVSQLWGQLPKSKFFYGVTGSNSHRDPAPQSVLSVIPRSPTENPFLHLSQQPWELYPLLDFSLLKLTRGILLFTTKKK